MDKLDSIRLAVEEKAISAKKLAELTTGAGHEVSVNTLLRGIRGETNIGYHTVAAAHAALQGWLRENPEEAERLNEIAAQRQASAVDVPATAR
jgi:hypothetical protein